MLIAQLCYMMSCFIRFKAVITAIGAGILQEGL